MEKKLNDIFLVQYHIPHKPAVADPEPSEGGAKNMKYRSNPLHSAAIFFMSFLQARGGGAPCPPPPGSATGPK